MSDVTHVVKDRYGKAAQRVLDGQTSGGCCSSTCCGPGDLLVTGAVDPITANLYDAKQTAACRPDAVTASLGCGNPTALAELNPGEAVLDLGSGGGIDVLLSARRVGPTGKAYGLDMTDEMLALARENQRKAGPGERRVPEGPDRAHPAARQLGRRHHLELRDQPVGRQGPGAARGVPRAQARRPLRRVRRRRAGRGAAGDPPQHGALGRLHLRARSTRRSTSRS